MFMNFNFIDILKGVPSVEKFADISAYVVLDAKSSSGVLMHELGDVKDEIVKND